MQIMALGFKQQLSADHMSQLGPGHLQVLLTDWNCEFQMKKVAFFFNNFGNNFLFHFNSPAQ